MSVICFSGLLADTEKSKNAVLSSPGTEGHPGYGFKVMDEGLRSAGASASVAALAVPTHGEAPGGIWI